MKNIKTYLGMILVSITILACFLPSVTVAADGTFTITATACAGGSISPAGAVSVNAGSDQTFTITPNSGENVLDVQIDHVSVGTPTSYTFTNIQANHSIAVSFTPYTLQLVGVSTVTLTQSQFENMAAQYPSTFTDNNSAVWTGIPLWRLIALVDDSDASTFNDSIATTYSIYTISSSDLNTFTIGDNGVNPVDFPHNDNIIVANKYNGGPVPPISSGGGGWVWAPLRLIGNDTGSGTSNFAHFGGGLVELQLKNIPPYIINQPSNIAVNNGASANFTASAGGDPPATVQWQVSTDGTTWNNISGATSTTLTLNAVTSAQNNSQYHAVFTNSAGSIITNAATLTVNPVAVVSGGSPPPPSATTTITTTTTPPGNLAGKINTTTGDFTAPVTVPSADNEANVSIVTGVTGTINGAPLTQITVAPAADPQTTPDSNANFRIGNVFYNFGPNGAQFSNPVTLTLPYDPSLGNNAYIAYWDTIANPPAWKSLSPPFEIDTVHNTITGQTTHFTVFSVLAPPIKPASFSFSNLSITPSEAAPGQDVVITATVTNSGDLSGRYSAQLLINGSVASTKSDSLAGNQAQTIGFSVHEDTAATYNVVLGDLKGSFTITAVEVTTTNVSHVTATTSSSALPSTTSIPTLTPAVTSSISSKATSPVSRSLIFGLIGVVVVIAIVIGILLFKKPTTRN